MTEPDNNAPLAFRLRHTMLPVADLDRSVAFYTGLLGMQVVRERRQPGGPAIAYVGYGDEGTHPVLELIAGSEGVGEPWAGHVAIAVSDLETLNRKLIAAGVRFKMPMKAPEGGSNRLIAMVLDPDGFEVELNERREGLFS